MINVSDKTRDYLQMLECKFNKENFYMFIKDLLNLTSEDIKNENEKKPTTEQYNKYIATSQLYAKYSDDRRNTIGILLIRLQDNKHPANARTLQRNYIAHLMDAYNLNASITAIYSSNDSSWRLSFVKQELTVNVGKLQTKVTPAKRYSYLFGENEPNHTAKKQLLELLENNEKKYSIEELEEKFSVEKVTKEFFENYKENYLKLYENLENNVEFQVVSEKYGFTTEEFAKKLMGQIVFLYFLQKKGWLGVSLVPKELTIEEYNLFLNKQDIFGKKVLEKYFVNFNGKKRLKGSQLKLLKENEEEIAVLSSIFINSKYDGEWGTGEKNFVRQLFNRYKMLVASDVKDRFFDYYLEPFFYNGLNYKRENQYFSIFNCKIPFLNGGLFEPIDNYKWELSEFKIKDEIFSNDEKTGILDFFDTYNFTINEEEPLEKEVAVDPEMLGKIFENLLDVKDRKSKGAFYTPREIVHYMCQEALANYLVNKVNVDYTEIKEFIQYGEIIRDEDLKSATNDNHLLGESIYKNILNIDKALKDIKIADPSVGSGAFPLGILNEIVKLRDILTTYMVIYAKNGNFNKNISIDRIIKNRSLYQLKWDAIKNSIYAVDIENSAIDITKLRLWLSIVVDQVDVPKTGPEPLPNLDFKIMQGNSLIDEFNGIKLIDKSIIDEFKKRNSFSKEEQMKLFKDDYTNVQLELFSDEREKKSVVKELIELKSLLYGMNDSERKREVLKQIDNCRKELFTISFKHNNSALNELIKIDNTHNKPYFSWELEFIEVFVENNGFDIVIGNPPYVDSEHMVKDENLAKTRELCNKLYKSAKGNWDLFIIFIELGFNHVNNVGNVSFIIPNKLIASNYAKAIRKIIKDNYLIEIRDYSNVNVFKEAAVYPVTFISNKTNIKTINDIRMIMMKDMTNIDWQNNIERDEFNKTENWDNFFAKNSKANEVINKILNNLRLSDIAEVKGAATVSEAYLIKEILYENENYIENYEFKFINTGTIDRYCITWDSGKTQYIKQGYYQPVLDKEKLKELSENRFFEASTEKIIIGGMTKILECYYDNGKCLAGKSTIIIFNSKKRLKYLIGILNSKLMTRFYQIYFNSLSLSGGFYRIGAPQIKELPIATVTENIENKVIDLVDKLIINPNDYETEDELNKIIYDIYGLSDEEINILEEN